jgi:glutamate 5-kinase
MTQQPSMAPADAVAACLTEASRVVVKVGTNVLMRDNGSLALGPLAGLIDSIATLRRAGRDVLLVSSGAVGLGADRLALAEGPRSVTMKQACAAVGQSRLMGVYEAGFGRLGLVAAQILLTENDLADQHRRRNLGAAVETLFRANVVPVVNENDSVSTWANDHDPAPGHAGTRVFEDNDMLAALMARTIGASVLVLLSDVDGLYSANPRHAAEATLLRVVQRVTPDLIAGASGGGVRGRGGMASKLAAARVATESGILTIIANGRRPSVVDDLWAGTAVGTAFLPADQTLELSK